jgi:adenylate cyclase
VERGLPHFEKLLIYTWRRHLTMAMQRMRPHVSAGAPAEVAVGFADLVGFTQLSRQLTSEELAVVVRRFESGATDLIVELGGRIIKSIGDEVLFVADEAAVAANIALALSERARRRTTSGIRVGVEFGPVITHAGDVFGDTVNLASRLTSLAEPHHVLVGPVLAEVLAKQPAFDVELLQPIDVKGFGPTTPAALRRRPRHGGDVVREAPHT